MSTVDDALFCARSAIVSLNTALAVLDRPDPAARPFAQGYSGSSAGRSLREAKRLTERARDLLTAVSEQRPAAS